jgi:hypothetical protein
MAELAVSNGECGAQLEIKDTYLREALVESVYRQINRAYQLAAACD